MKKIFFNIFLLIIFILIAEIIAFILHSKPDVDEIKLLYKKSTLQAVLITINNFYNPWAYNRIYYKNTEFRKPIIKNIPNNKEIALYGCSFTHGFSLPDNETFNSYLAKYTNYDIYNYGLSGGCPREILYILSHLNNKNFNTKYVIYTYIPHHKARLYINYRPKVPFYVRYNDGLKYLKYNPIYFSSLMFYIQKYIFYKYIVFSNKKEMLLLTYLQEIQKQVKAKYPNAEFITLVYCDYDNENSQNMWAEAKKMGIKVIKVSDIVDVNIDDEEYKIPNDFHPNAKAWEVIVPALAKELNL